MIADASNNKRRNAESILIRKYTVGVDDFGSKYAIAYNISQWTDDYLYKEAEKNGYRYINNEWRLVNADG